MGELILLCQGHICPECKSFWKHTGLKPKTGFYCNNVIVIMPCPDCYKGPDKPKRFPILYIGPDAA